MTIQIIIPKPNHYNECFRETAQSVEYALQKLGHETDLHDSDTYFDISRSRDLHIFFGANTLPQTYKFPAKSVIYNLEQPTSGALGYTLGLAKNNIHVWEFSRHNLPFWHKHGIPFSSVAIGYTPNLTWNLPPVEKDIDAFFAGCLKGAPGERRSQVLNTLKSHGLKVVECHDDKLMFGAERNALINRSKLLLNLHYYSHFEIVRAALGLANQVLVLSEPSDDDDHYRWLDGGIVRSNDILKECKRLIGDPQERKRITKQGFEAFQRQDMVARVEQALKRLPNGWLVTQVSGTPSSSTTITEMH